MNEPIRELVVTAVETGLPWAEAFEFYVVKVLETIRAEQWDLGIRLTTDEELQTLNRDFRGKDEPTDVLSFGSDVQTLSDDPSSNTEIFGDLAISLTTVRNNASYFGVSEEEELKRVTLHGLLHLQGWDHITNESGEPMLIHQEVLLRLLSEVRLF